MTAGPYTCSRYFLNEDITAYRHADTYVITISAGKGYTLSSSYNLPTANLNSTILSSGTLLEDVIRVYWRETDLPKFDPEYASILAKRLDLDFTATATATPTATAADATGTATPPTRSELTPATSTAAPEQAHRSGLSTGAKAGIGIGVPIASILMLWAAFVLYKRNRQKKNGKMTESVAAQNAQPELVQTRVS
jgi:hypothetical protein